MTTQTALEPDLLNDSDFLRESTLIKKAAHCRKLVLPEEPRKKYSHPEFESEIVETFNLDDSFLTALRKTGFSFEPGTKPPYDKMVYLSGNSNQRGAEVFESDSWKWEREKTGLQLTINFNLYVDEGKRGVVCIPHIWGNCSGGACHRPTINKFVGVVAEHFPSANSLIKEAVEADFEPVISWTAISLGGIKSVGRLFHELYGRKEKVTRLADSQLSPFSPSPNRIHRNFETDDRQFVLEVDQARLFEQWKKQLQDFKTNLS